MSRMGAAVVAAFALSAAAFAQQGNDRSSTLNNEANRALEAPPTPAEQFQQVPGGRATPKSQWRTGDERGKPQARRHRRARRASAKKKRNANVPPAESAGAER